MLVEHYELIEEIILNVTLIGLFIFMILAVRDILKKNKVPAVGQAVVYLVLFLGAAGFIFKGIVQLMWQANG